MSDRQEIGGGPARRPGKPAAAGDDAPYVPSAPYQLTSTCELSEDYFLVQNHRIDPDKDAVVAYSRSDGLVESIVLQDGVVKQIYRDPAQAGGWNVLALPDTRDVTFMVAAVSDPYNDPKQASLHVYYTSTGHPDLLTIASQPIILPADGAAPTFSTETVPWHHSAGALQVTLNADNTPFVAAMVPSTKEGSTDARMYYCTDCRSAVQPTGGVSSWTSSGYLTGFEYFVSTGSASFVKAGGLSVGWSVIVAQPNLAARAPWMTLYLPSFAYSDESANPMMRVWAAALMAGRLGATSVTDWRSLGISGHRAAVPKPGSTGYVASIDFATVLGSTFEPTLLVRIVDQVGSKVGQRLSILTRNDKDDTWRWTELALPDATSTSVSLATATRPVPAGESGKGVESFLDVFLVSGNTLNVIRQSPTGNAVTDGTSPSYTPVLPLQDHVAVMTSQPGVSTGNELMLVGADGTLQTLEKDPVSGSWTDTVLHLPAAEMQPDSAYRVTLTLADSAWNVPVTGQDLTIVASAPAVAAIEGPSPRTVVLGADAVTVTTGSDGQANLALLATGLSAPTLTITGSGLPAPVTVYPSGQVNAYMQGSAGLNYLQPMKADTLAHATTPDGQTVAPGAADPEAAKEAATNMKQAADWAVAGIRSGRVSSTVRRRDGVASRHHRKLGTHVPGGVLDHWAQDALHAIKKGAIGVKTITKDVEHKAFVFATDVADWADHEITIAVQGIEDAAHVLHAALNKLAADILHAVKWLEAEVIGVFRSAKALSDKFEGWMDTFSGFAASTLATNETRALTWIKGEQQWVTTELTTLAGRFSPRTTLSTMAANPPNGARATGRPADGKPNKSRPVGATDDDQTSPHGDWFYHKIKHELAGSGLKIDLSKTPDLKAKITSFGQKSLAHSGGFQTRFIEDFWKGFLNGVVHHPDDVDGVLVQPLLQALLKVVDDAFDYAENIVAEAFDLLRDIAVSFKDLLSTPLKDLPILGALMKLIGLGDVSVGRVANLIFAFPTALVYKIAHGAQAQPFAASASKRSRGTVGDVASDLQICAASVMGTWAVFDTISAAFVAGGDDGGILFSAIDIAAPLIVTILTTPAVKDGEPFFAPPVSGDAADVLGFLAWVLGAIPAFCAALPLVIEKFFAKGEGAKDLVQTTVWFQSLTGVLALVFGMVANSQKDTPKGADYAGSVLNNMPTIAGAGLSEALIEATAGISVVVAMALTLICGGIGAVVYGDDG